MQVVVETHSEHVMDGIRLAVKEGAISADAVAFHYLSRADRSATSIESPRLSGSGKLEFWPKGFFDETLEPEPCFQNWSLDSTITYARTPFPLPLPTAPLPRSS